MQRLRYVFAGVLLAALPAFGVSAASSPFSQSKFVPDISLIADFSAVARSVDDATYRRLSVPGLLTSVAPEEAPLERGFNYDYAELGLAAAVDPFLDLRTVFHVGREGFEPEEVFADLKQLPCGFAARAGKFLSAFGRENERHGHAWDFNDRPLVQRAFFGDEGLNDVGARLTWLAPTGFYLLVGVEGFQGATSNSFGRDGFSDPNGSAAADGVAGPSLATGFVKTSLDLGDAVLLAGVSVARGKTRLVEEFGTTDGSALDGEATLAGVDLLVKWSFDSYSFLAFQSEAMWRVIEGDRWTTATNGAAATAAAYRKSQFGGYAQLVWRGDESWKAGVRWDWIAKNDETVAGSDQDLPSGLSRYTLMLEYAPSEFSRFRLQYAYDRSGYDNGVRKPNHELGLAMNVMIGAHGAHSL